MIINFIKIMYTLKKKPFNAILFSLLLTTLSACGGELTVEETISATLTWDAPTTNTDGTALTDLAGYKVYYGTSSGNYTTPLDVGNITTYNVTGLSTGTTYYFAVTAYDSSGNESDYSIEYIKTI